jgi:hypothetical protein
MKRKCADGGKVKGSEYGKPTYARSVMAKVGIGDGYGNPKNAPKDKNADKRMSISNAPSKFGEAMAKRKEELNSYANGGKVKKRKGC